MNQEKLQAIWDAYIAAINAPESEECHSDVIRALEDVGWDSMADRE